MPKRAKKSSAEKTDKKPAAKRQKYIFAIGRRKTALAKVRLYPQGTGEITVNGRAFAEYFPTFPLQEIITAPLELLGQRKKVDLLIQASGGGVVAQAEASRLGIARALVKKDPEVKTVLKKQELLTRDARVKERKKPGLKRARRAPQWQKR